jgi:hypothetical protein
MRKPSKECLSEEDCSGERRPYEYVVRQKIIAAGQSQSYHVNLPSLSVRECVSE